MDRLARWPTNNEGMRMNLPTRHPVSLRDDQRGAVTVEYAMLLAGFVVPMMLVFKMLLDILATIFEMMVFLLDMPFI
jgi:Flp pilus assembly pilin Flp